MSAILSESQLNDFITPGVACIKPVETLPASSQPPTHPENPYEVTTEDRLAATNPTPAPASISLTDCLACSGCVTSAEAVLISLQSHDEVLNTLATHRSLSLTDATRDTPGRLFVASVSPQVRASLAATYNVSTRTAAHWIDHLLRAQGFTYTLDTNALRSVVLAATADESLHPSPVQKRPLLASACPGWICYAEKTHSHILPHLSRLKSPQALAGALVKSVLARKYGVAPDRVWHLSVMPCFDKKLEASRHELTDAYWNAAPDGGRSDGVRDVDCVITSRELLLLAEARGWRIPELPRGKPQGGSFPDEELARFLGRAGHAQTRDVGPSGGYAYAVLRRMRRRWPGAEIRTQRGRLPDVLEYSLVAPDGEVLAKTARYYGFQNIQNLVRRLRPARASRLTGVVKRPQHDPGGKGGAAGALQEYLYIEVMACPSGCTNGGGQIRLEEAVPTGEESHKPSIAQQKEWLGRVDEAYYSAESASEDEDGEGDVGIERESDGEDDDGVERFLQRWVDVTGLEKEKLLFTGFKAVESDVGKKTSEMERVAGLAGAVGGGW